MRFKLVPDDTRINFMRVRLYAFAVSLILIAASMALFATRGLNYGIDFTGGIMIEVGTPGPADLSRMRSVLGGLGFGDVALQEFGAPDDVLIRIQRQPGGEEAQNAAVERVKAALAQTFGADISYRRVEVVGPKVSGELVRKGAIAFLAAMAAMLVYIWFRFEWQFGIGAVVALLHDVLLTVGMFAFTQIEFNLSSIAAILTIVGYSMNDTVVVYDRVRENMRKYKAMPLVELLTRSVNDTLSRTTMTSVTTLIALVTLYIFGGEVIAGFSFAMIWGIVVGTYSSIFVAAPLLINLGVRQVTTRTPAEAKAGG